MYIIIIGIIGVLGEAMLLLFNYSKSKNDEDIEENHVND